MRPRALDMPPRIFSVMGSGMVRRSSGSFGRIENGGPSDASIGMVDLLDGFAVRKEAEIPGRAEADEEIHSVCQRRELIGNVGIGV
jgi:hypothetical protein